MTYVACLVAGVVGAIIGSVATWWIMSDADEPISDHDLSNLIDKHADRVTMHMRMRETPNGFKRPGSE